MAHLRLPQHLRGNLAVDLLGREVAHHVHQVEAREQGVRQADVLGQVQCGVKVPIDWVGSREHAAPRVQRHVHARLGNGDALLLHRLVDGDLILLVHELKLVDAADAVVGEHQCAGLDDLLLVQVCVLHHGGGEASRGGRLAGCKDRAREERRRPLQQGTLRRCRIAQDAHVDVPAELDPLVRLLGHPSDQHQQDALLDLQVALDGRSDAPRQDVEAVPLTARADMVGDLLEAFLVALGEVDLVI
mmetsp:Transcript_42323/g.122401  ORF Transcript_42323/g.122401 Transcript_42323/m.122401 type:complete len:245 (+) Transcript_42323:1143-1877(+)